jgi:hypothetical protein
MYYEARARFRDQDQDQDQNQDRLATYVSLLGGDECGDA